VAKLSSTTVIGHDFHVPHQDHKAVKVFLSVIKELQPKRIIMLGDIADCGQISRWSTPADRLTQIQDDLDETAGLFADVRRMAPKSEIDFQSGNHEDRLTKWACANPNMANLRFIGEPLKFFGLEKIGKIRHVKYLDHIQIMDTIFTHGHRVCKNSGATALANIQAYGHSTYCGHTHRISKVHLTVGGRNLSGYEGGCMCDLNASYMPTGVANWQHGFAVAHEIKGVPQLQIQQIQIIDGTAFHNGRVFSA
jgi:metallophosphoesterase superfamily enzyme